MPNPPIIADVPYRRNIGQSCGDFAIWAKFFAAPATEGAFCGVWQVLTATGSVATPGSARLPPSRSSVRARLPPSRISVRARLPPSRPPTEPTSCRCPTYLRSSGVEDAGVRLLIGLVQQNEDSAASHDYFASWRERNVNLTPRRKGAKKGEQRNNSAF